MNMITGQRAVFGKSIEFVVNLKLPARSASTHRPTVEQPAKCEFVINLKAAKQIGVTIPPNVLAREDRVIK